MRKVDRTWVLLKKKKKNAQEFQKINRELDNFPKSIQISIVCM